VSLSDLVGEADDIFVAHSANCGNDANKGVGAVENGGIKSSPPYEGGVAAASADGVVL